MLATVVRSVRPASARPGDRALLPADGPSEGWVGGGCVQTSIEREASRALSDGAPRLVKLSPQPLQEDGVVTYPMTCHSGGELDIYLEPVLPAPELVVLGDSIVAHALAELAAPLGFRLRTTLESITPADAWVVVAGMSSGEDQPLVRDAVMREVRYVAMVASRRRAEAVRAELRADGVAEDALRRLKAPAGLDIGAATGAEIALSILAEIVQQRRASTPAPSVASPSVAIDPICGMQVDVATAKWTLVRDGQTYYFCAPGCRKAFVAEASLA
ncbi:MAG: XdhC family protein [Chloroflexi bacterium]|nr:XdhC family protein [Chloroflexota bacterium]MBV9546602.1 XdhC family protein [Chloroflexota bacterium]